MTEELTSVLWQRRTSGPPQRQAPWEGANNENPLLALSGERSFDLLCVPLLPYLPPCPAAGISGSSELAAAELLLQEASQLQVGNKKHRSEDLIGAPNREAPMKRVRQRSRTADGGCQVPIGPLGLA